MNTKNGVKPIITFKKAKGMMNTQKISYPDITMIRKINK